MDLDNSVVVAEGRKGGREVEDGLWGINGDGRRLDLGW